MQQDAYTLPEGVTFSDIARPDTTSDLSDLLQSASGRNVPVVPVGGGTSLCVGNPVSREYLGIDLRGLSGVRSYEPADLTASFHAGTTLAEVNAVLGEHGQELPLDMPQEDRATIGGLVATGFSGPRRLGSGTLKDLLIGCGYVRGDGLVAKAGGMLVKNVSGFEIPRLMHGSWGSLAVLTSVNLKVVPKPKADFTFSSLFDSLPGALNAQEAVLARHPLIHASTIEQHDGVWKLRVRVLGREGALRAQVASIEDDLDSRAELVEDNRTWRDFNERWVPESDQVRIVCGSRPHRIPDIATSMTGWPGVSAMAVSMPTGSVRIAVSPARVSSGELVERLESLRATGEVTWVLESAPSSWRGDTPAWSDPGPSIAIMQSIKQQFDPAGVLNPGRLVI